MSSNAVENEPFFLIMAVAWPMLGTPSEAAPQLLMAYVATRYLHWIIFVLVKRQPWRAIAWTAGVFINLGIAYSIYKTVA